MRRKKKEERIEEEIGWIRLRSRRLGHVLWLKLSASGGGQALLCFAVPPSPSSSSSSPLHFFSLHHADSSRFSNGDHHGIWGFHVVQLVILGLRFHVSPCFSVSIHVLLLIWRDFFFPTTSSISFKNALWTGSSGFQLFSVLDLPDLWTGWFLLRGF